MIFIITKFSRPGTEDGYAWTLYRKDKKAEDGLGDPVARSVEVFASERQVRAAINRVKKTMSGNQVRFAQTRVSDG